MVPTEIPHSVLAWLAPGLRQCLAAARVAAVEEIRLSAGRPLMLVATGGDCLVGADGRPVTRSDQAVTVSREDVGDTLQLMTRGSIYALDEEFRRGYLTLPGGHRVGMVGRTVLERGRVRTLRDIAGLNLRLAREVKGCADALVPVVTGNGLQSLLLVSPPRGGKTTMLRDLVRQLSDGATGPGYRVGLIDERSEVAGCSEGVPQLDVGLRTDVLDGCLKVEGVPMLVRAMAPDIVACDEIGGPAEAEVLADAIKAGVRVMATAHARCLADALSRPWLGPVLEAGVFDRVAVLGRALGPGTLEAVQALRNGEASWVFHRLPQGLALARGGG